jgi:thiamine phosphate synthase YjbQ (UPF0047 family)
MILTKNFFIDATKGLDLLNVVHEVRRVVREANTENGTVTVVIPNPGAGVAVIDTGDPAFKADGLKKALEPHLASGLIRCFLPKSVVIPFEKGKLHIEPFQEIFVIDYDTSGKRREFRVQVTADTPPPAPGKKGMGPGGPPHA